MLSGRALEPLINVILLLPLGKWTMSYWAREIKRHGNQTVSLISHCRCL